MSSHVVSCTITKKNKVFLAVYWPKSNGQLAATRWSKMPPILGKLSQKVTNNFGTRNPEILNSTPELLTSLFTSRKM